MRTKTPLPYKRSVTPRKIAHLLWYRKSYGAWEHEFNRMLHNKGGHPPAGAYCYRVPNRAGKPRFQSLITDIVRMRLSGAKI